ncbi:MAG: aspartate/glutamate racemase family protein, partial [Alphaproteobacteria bacterium]|nr:aspartate/glutamate racemase family protein [Alphaproteobacteria bacterium]
IGVLATLRTVSSGTWVTEIGKLGPHRVSQQAAALLAPLVEEGWEDTSIADLAIARYLEALGDVDTIVLGCTHYPLLGAAFRRVTDTPVLDPAPFIAQRLVDWLDRHPGFASPGAGRLRVLCSGDPERFAAQGARFLGHPLEGVGHVGLVDSRLLRREPNLAPTGQIVR